MKHKVKLDHSEIFLLLRALDSYTKRGVTVTTREVQASVSARNKLNKAVRKEVKTRVGAKSWWPW